jgi:hypothetical protein
VAVKNAVYVLPFNEKTYEDFQWLRQEIEAAGGEAAVFRAGSVEGKTDDEIIASFNRQRDEEYAQLTAELEGLYGALREQKRGGHFTLARLTQYESELSKLRLELERIESTDFFHAARNAPTRLMFEKCQKALHASKVGRKETKEAVEPESRLATARYQGKLWITRRNLHIDRLASAWLIRRFIDQRPRFRFVEDGNTVQKGIPFDVFGAEFAHQGEDCTFETLIKRFDLEGDVGLRELAEIVHDIDLKDDKFHRTEAAGVNAAVVGLSRLVKDDRKLIQHTTALFDGLYKLLSKAEYGNESVSNDKHKRRTDRSRKGTRRGATR